jgi:hypothetical protein
LVRSERIGNKRPSRDGPSGADISQHANRWTLQVLIPEMKLHDALHRQFGLKTMGSKKWRRSPFNPDSLRVPLIAL